MTFARLGIVFKARNLAADPRCAVAAPLEGFDVTSAVALKPTGDGGATKWWFR